MSDVTPTPPPARERLDSLDVFRGITVAAMILVNNMGDRRQIYRQLDHAEWHGCTLTDLIFPFFLFIVGVSITLSFARRPKDADVFLPILRRASTLFLLGLLLTWVPFTQPGPVRLPGVLQRIGVVYLFAALIASRTTWRAQAWTAGGLLALHTLILRFVPVPDVGAFVLEKGQDVGSWIDARLLGQRAAEGLLSTVPAIATALTGVLAGRWLTSERPPYERTSGLFFAGLLCAAAGFAAQALVPINKNLWTASYVLFSSGLGCQALAACYWLIDLQGVRAWAPPFLAFGRNPIVIYWASHALARVLVFGVTWPDPASPTGLTNAKAWVHTTLFARGPSTCASSLAYAAVYLALWWAVAAVLDRKRIYVKV